MSQSPQSKPFYCYPHSNGSGIYQVEIRDRITGVMLPRKSTGTCYENEADRIAWRWYYEGIPEGRTGGRQTTTRAAEFEVVLNDFKSLPLTLAEAQRVVSVLQSQGLIGDVPMASDGPNLIDWLVAFWDYNTSKYIKEKHIHGHELSLPYANDMQRKIKKYWKPFFGDFQRDKLTRENMKEFGFHLADYRRKIKKHGEEIEIPLPTSTIKHILKAGSVAFKWSYEEGEIETNPTANLMKYTQPGRERGLLTHDELYQLFTIGSWTGTDGNRIGSIVAYQTGLRLGEILALRVKDIENGFIAINHSWNYYVDLKAPKNGAPVKAYYYLKLST